MLPHITVTNVKVHNPSCLSIGQLPGYNAIVYGEDNEYLHCYVNGYYWSVSKSSDTYKDIMRGDMIKIGASIDTCRAEILRAYIKIIQPVFRVHGFDAVITSGSESYKHSATRSRHYSGDALDIRSKSLGDKKHVVLNDLINSLGSDFVAVLESEGKVNEHFHIHYAPVYHDGDS